MIIGYLPGVFDFLHSGHRRLIQRAQKMCDQIIIGIHTDNFVEEYKRKPKQSQDERRQQIHQNMNIPLKDIIFVGGTHTEVIRKYHITKIIHGNDWEIESYKRQIGYYRDNLADLDVEVVLVNYTKGISTSDILKKNIPDLSNIDNFYFDLDNTLLIGDSSTPFASECIQKLQQMKKTLKVVTNNNRYTPEIISKKLKSLNIPIEEDDILSSLQHVCRYLKKNYPQKSIYVWGTPDSKIWLEKKKIQVVKSPQDKIDVVVVLYTNSFDYKDLTQLCDLCKLYPWICGNKDLTYPDDIHTYPDTGAISNLVTSVCGKPPIVVCGKPNPDIISVSINSIMIGDNLLTDAILAKNLNMPFILISDKESHHMTISHLGVLLDYLKLSESVSKI